MSYDEGLNPYAAKSAVAPVEEAVDPVPAGTAAEILAWVDGDSERAQRALEAENAGHQRKTLTAKLEELTSK